VIAASIWTVWLASPASMALQLVLCLLLGTVLARSTGRDVRVWLAVGFTASIVPLAGLLALATAVVLVRSSSSRRD